MKKLLLMMILCLVMMSNSVNLCSANLKDYYDNNPDYVHVATGHFYLPSIDVQEYNPPYYQIAGKFAGTDGYDRKRESIEIVRFNWYTKETFHKNKYGNWEKEEVSDDYHKRYPKLRANALFRAAYEMNFYNWGEAVKEVTIQVKYVDGSAKSITKTYNGIKSNIT